MRQLVQNTNSLSIGKLSQNQIKIGSGSGSNVGIYFNNGNENLPGIRFLNSNEDEYIFHFDTSTGIFNSQSWPQGEEAIFYFKKYYSSTKRSGWIATSSTGVSLGLTGILNQESQWIIVRAYNIEDPASGPIVIAATATLPNLASWGSYGNVCTLEYIPPVKEWQYSNDGSNWFSIKPGKSSIDLSYELISITSSDLVDGIATIKHNLGQKYVLGLDYTVTPDNIEYTDENILTLDYSKHDTLDCKVWFYKSKQSMLQIVTNESKYIGKLNFVAGEGWPTECSNECCSVDDFRSSSSNQNSYYEIADNSKSGIERVWHLYNNCDGANHLYYNEIYYNKEKLRWELSDGCCTDGETPNYLYAYTNADTDISQAKNPWEYEWNFNNEIGTITSDVKSSIIKVE